MALRDAQGRFLTSAPLTAGSGDGTKKKRKKKRRSHRAKGRHSTRSRGFDTSRAVALDKNALRRDIAQAERQARKARLAQLRTVAKVARASKKPRIQAVRTQCAIERQELRNDCAGRREYVKGDVASIVTRSRAQLEQDKRDRRELRAAERFGKVFRGPKVASAAKERESESDDAVRANIDPYLVPYFDHVKRGIRGTAHKSRTEAFLDYVDETPGEMAAFNADNADAAQDAMIAEYESRGARDERRTGT